MSMKEEVHKEKSEFVAHELAEMLKSATRGDVKECRYEVNGEYEIVNVYAGQEPVVPAFVVNVTCDSLWAIAKDVMKAVAKFYE